jgi:hypothetical protein
MKEDELEISIERSQRDIGKAVTRPARNSKSISRCSL